MIEPTDTYVPSKERQMQRLTAVRLKRPVARTAREERSSLVSMIQYKAQTPKPPSDTKRASLKW